MSGKNASNICRIGVFAWKALEIYRSTENKREEERKKKKREEPNRETSAHKPGISTVNSLETLKHIAKSKQLSMNRNLKLILLLP